MWIRSLGWEDPPEKGIATHPRILACKIPWTVVSSGLQPMGLQRVRHDRAHILVMTLGPLVNLALFRYLSQLMSNFPHEKLIPTCL